MWAPPEPEQVVGNVLEVPIWGLHPGSPESEAQGQAALKRDLM